MITSGQSEMVVVNKGNRVTWGEKTGPPPFFTISSISFMCASDSDGLSHIDRNFLEGTGAISTLTLMLRQNTVKNRTYRSILWCVAIICRRCDRESENLPLRYLNEMSHLRPDKFRSDIVTITATIQDLRVKKIKSTAIWRRKTRKN